MVDDSDRHLPDATPDRDYDTLSERPPGLSPGDRPKVPSTLPPRGAFDTHLPLLDGGDTRFDDWARRLRTHLATLEIDRGVIVAGDRRGGGPALIEALARLGDGMRGVGVVSPETSDEALDRMAAAGIRGLRVVPDGPCNFDRIADEAGRLAQRGLHIELPGGIAGENLADLVAALDCPVVLADCGVARLPGGPDDPAFDAVRRLAGEGRAYVKLMAPGDPADTDRLAPYVRALAETAPERCLWGSGGPLDAATHDAGVLLDRFFDSVRDPAARQAILVDAPAALYGG